MTFVVLFALASLVSPAASTADERRLINDLLLNYNRLERPTLRIDEPVVLTMNLDLRSILDLDEMNQVLTTNMWLDLSWNDANLRWNAVRERDCGPTFASLMWMNGFLFAQSDYGGIDQVRIPPEQMWMPDLLLHNSASETFDTTLKTNVIVYSSGDTSFIPPGIFSSTCSVSMTYCVRKRKFPPPD